MRGVYVADGLVGEVTVIARDADAKEFSRILQAPILILTFMAGPIGLFLWLLVREPRARALGRWS